MSRSKVVEAKDTCAHDQAHDYFLRPQRTLAMSLHLASVLLWMGIADLVSGVVRVVGLGKVDSDNDD